MDTLKLDAKIDKIFKKKVGELNFIELKELLVYFGLMKETETFNIDLIPLKKKRKRNDDSYHK